MSKGSMGTKLPRKLLLIAKEDTLGRNMQFESETPQTSDKEVIVHRQYGYIGSN